MVTAKYQPHRTQFQQRSFVYVSFACLYETRETLEPTEEGFAKLRQLACNCAD